MRAQLKQLQEAITAIECGNCGSPSAAADASRSNPSTDTLPMPPGLHEWFGLADAPRWIPPLGILLYLVSRSLTGEGGEGGAGGGGLPGSDGTAGRFSMACRPPIGTCCLRDRSSSIRRMT